MINSDYYSNYIGPELISAKLWKKNDEKINITESIKEFYGENKNWNGKLYTYNDVFPNKDHQYHFRIDFIDDSGRKHWFYGMVGNKEQFFNPPLASPFNQNI